MYRSNIYRVPSKETANYKKWNFSDKLIINMVIDQACWVILAEYLAKFSFCMFMDQDDSRSINTQKKNKGFIICLINLQENCSDTWIPHPLGTRIEKNKLYFNVGEKALGWSGEGVVATQQSFMQGGSTLRYRTFINPFIYCFIYLPPCQRYICIVGKLHIASSISLDELTLKI